MTNAFENELEIFHGEATAAHARVYVRLDRKTWPKSAALHGSIRGPFSQYAQTLPSSYDLVDLGPGSTLLCEARIPDPCFWTPALPNLYEAEVELRHQETVLASAKLLYGIRPLGVRGRDFIFDSKRWVMRAGRGGHASSESVSAYREHNAMVFAPQYDPMLFAEASRCGVFVITNTLGSSNTRDGALDRLLSRHAAIGIVIVNETQNGTEVRRCRNLIYAQLVPTDRKLETAPWADALIGDAQLPDAFARQFQDCTLPVIAMAGPEESGDVSSVRERCDALQRRLAGKVECAGFIV